MGKKQVDDAHTTQLSDLHNFQIMKQSLLEEIEYANEGSEEIGEQKAAAEGDFTVTSVARIEGLCVACLDKTKGYEAATESSQEKFKPLEQTADLHNFQITKQSLLNEIEYANEGSEESGEKKAAAEGDFTVTSVAMIEGLCVACLDKAQGYEAATESSEEKFKALQQAKNVEQFLQANLALDAVKTNISNMPECDSCGTTDVSALCGTCG